MGHSFDNCPIKYKKILRNIGTFLTFDDADIKLQRLYENPELCYKERNQIILPKEA